MKVKLKEKTPNIERNIVEIARVSSSREDKSSEPEGLINYLINNNHWSPFEHAMITMEIETSKAIGIQLIRHRSFTFQELSQRYADVSKMTAGDMFEEVEIRKQATNNRQSSEEVFDPLVTFDDGIIVHSNVEASIMVESHLEQSQNLYETLINAGVAREQARMVLPMATKTTIFMSGTVRSWIHMLDIRDDSHAQKEIQLISKEIKKILIKELPIISKARGWKI